MSLPVNCPICSQTLVASRIIKSEMTTWDELVKELEMRPGAEPPFPSNVYFHAVVECRHCKSSIHDLLLGKTDDSACMAEFNMKRKLYDGPNQVVWQNMLGIPMGGVIVQKTVIKAE